MNTDEHNIEPVFDFSANAAAESGLPDEDLYKHILDMATLGHELGYDAVWMVEHHFSDYYPQPSPLLLLSHIAAACPQIGLGSMVLVTPWYDPRRLAEEIAMLSNLTKGDLHLGLGRGTAPMEYEAFDVPMEEAVERFEETFKYLELALQGEPFTFEGKTTRFPRELALRPSPQTDKINFYGAIGNPDSAVRMADLGISPLSISYFPMDLQAEIVRQWNDESSKAKRAMDTTKTIAINCMIADTDAEAEKLARKYWPLWFQLQLEHYEVDKKLHRNIKSYEAFDRWLGRFHLFADSETIDEFLDLQLIGSAETICAQIQAYEAAGYNRFIIQTGVPGTPREMQTEMLKRFAAEVAPNFSERFRKPNREPGLRQISS